ncbi:MAG: DUF2911 domain-containing protein [Flavobacteriales bacterium]|nr:DUF2911 domain-containing protein [Flavobacteriales bacterium]
MKRTLMTMTMALSTGLLFAQLELPVPSPKAKVEQRVGLTDVTIEYSRPAVAGRKIWGGLVPMDKVWRTGANSATAITFGKEVEIAGKTIAAGEYALFTIPSANEWTIIINTNEGQKGSTDYKESLDVLRFKAKATAAPEFKERLEFTVDPVSDNEGMVHITWEKTRVSFGFKTNSVKNAEANLAAFERKTGGLWYDLAQAARYSNANGLNADKALAWIDQSISLKDHFFNKWVKAQILAKKGDNAGAYQWAAEAKANGEKNPSGFYDAYKAEIEKAVIDWAAFAPKGKGKK